MQGLHRLFWCMKHSVSGETELCQMWGDGHLCRLRATSNLALVKKVQKNKKSCWQIRITVVSYQLLRRKRRNNRGWEIQPVRESRKAIRGRNQKDEKSTWQTRKTLIKYQSCCKRDKATQPGTTWEVRKSFKKSLKKYLTSTKRCAKITKPMRTANGTNEKMNLDNWTVTTLKIHLSVIL